MCRLQVVDLVPKYVQLLLVEDPKALITKAIGAMTDHRVAELMSPSEDIKARRSDCLAVLETLREAEQMLFDVAQMDTAAGP